MSDINEVNINLSATGGNETAKDIQKVADSLDQTSASADKTAASFDKLSASEDKATESTKAHIKYIKEDKLEKDINQITTVRNQIGGFLERCYNKYDGLEQIIRSENRFNEKKYNIITTFKRLSKKYLIFGEFN